MDILTASTLAVLTITGPARVIDGDTVVVNQTHVRLKGVDAAEMNTALGKHSKQVMIAIVNKSQLTCYLTGEKTYKRDVGYCFTEAHVDINQEIIARGAALSCPRYDTRYVQFETEEAITNQQRARYCGTPKRAIPAAAPTAAEPSLLPPPPPPPVASKPALPAPKPQTDSGLTAGWLWFWGIWLVVMFGVCRFVTRFPTDISASTSVRQRRGRGLGLGAAFVRGAIYGLFSRGRRRW
jgi:hypothetical protein